MSLARRRIILAATALTTAASSRDRKPIYSAPDRTPELEQLSPTALEYNIALARTHAESVYGQTHSWVKSHVEDWIALEERVERRVKSFRSPTEPLTPGVLYVFTSTLFGSILARSSILLRFTLPTAFFISSAFHFLPETSANISKYIYGLEKDHVPELARVQTDVSRTAVSGWQSVHEGWSAGRQAVEAGVQKTAGWIADTTGLKVHEVFGVTRYGTAAGLERLDEGIQKLKEKAESALEK